MTVLNLSDLVGKDVFTRNAKYVGKIDDTMLDTEKGNLYGFAIAMAKDSFLAKMISPDVVSKKTILIPYREVLAVGDIVLVTVPHQYERTEPQLETNEPEEEVVLPPLE